MIYVFIPYHCTNNILLNFRGIHCSLITKYEFFVSLRNEGVLIEATCKWMSLLSDFIVVAENF